MINNLLLKIATDLCSSYKLFGEIPAGRNKKILFTAVDVPRFLVSTKRRNNVESTI